jgi:hypothetical protein
MSAAHLVDDEFPARTRLKGAQERLAAALAAADAAGKALERGKETLAVLEQQRDAAKAETVEEAIALAETFAENGVVAMIGGASQRQREIDDELGTFRISLDILIRKNSDAQRAISECEAALAVAVKGVVSEETEPILCRLRDFENAAAMLRSELRALQFSGRFGLCPESLPRQLSSEPVNVFHSDKPLSFEQQKRYDRQKAAWRTFAEQLRENAGAVLSFGD